MVLIKMSLSLTFATYVWPAYWVRQWQRRYAKLEPWSKYPVLHRVPIRSETLKTTRSFLAYRDRFMRHRANKLAGNNGLVLCFRYRYVCANGNIQCTAAKPLSLVEDSDLTWMPPFCALEVVIVPEDSTWKTNKRLTSPALLV